LTTRVKICGITRPEDALAVAGAGADFLGLVLTKSPRQVDPSVAASWLECIRDSLEVVGVFRDASFQQVIELTEQLDLDFVQLHGTETGEEWHRLPVRLIEARIVQQDRLPPTRFAGAAWAELLDAGAGSGSTFDWKIAATTARERRTFLAGGLTVDNVSEAIETVQPFAVDVSSGVEDSPGVKNHVALKQFVQACRGVHS